MISYRFVPALLIVVAVPLLPTFIHSYAGLTIDDGLRTSAVEMTLGEFRGAATSRRPAWGESRFASQDWIERHYRGNGETIRLFVGRSFDPKKLYHHPELAIAYGNDLREAGTIRLAERSEVPIHALESPRERDRGIALYALLYNGRFVSDPIRFQLRTSGELLVGRRQPMTLFFVHAPDAPVGQPLDQTSAARLLLQSIRSFEAQKPKAS